MKTYISFVLGAVAMIGVTGISFASGSGDYGQQTVFQKKADRLYEEGKSYYYARGADGKRIDYCIKNGDQLERVSRRSLRQFESTSAEELSAHLCDCDRPDQMIDAKLNEREVAAVVYYLNKRYHLSLYSSS